MVYKSVSINSIEIKSHHIPLLSLNLPHKPYCQNSVVAINYMTVNDPEVNRGQIDP